MGHYRPPAVAHGSLDRYAARHFIRERVWAVGRAAKATGPRAARGEWLTLSGASLCRAEEIVQTLVLSHG